MLLVLTGLVFITLVSMLLYYKWRDKVALLLVQLGEYNTLLQRKLCTITLREFDDEIPYSLIKMLGNYEDSVIEYERHHIYINLKFAGSDLYTVRSVNFGNYAYVYAVEAETSGKIIYFNTFEQVDQHLCEQLRGHTLSSCP